MLVGAVHKDHRRCAQDCQYCRPWEGRILLISRPIQEQIMSFGYVLLKVLIEMIEKRNPSLKVSLHSNRRASRSVIHFILRK